MKRIILTVLLAAGSNILAQPAIENLTLRAPGLGWVGTIHGTLTATGGNEPITFQISNNENANVTLQGVNPDYPSQVEFTAEIIDTDAPASFQYVAIDTKNQTSAPATVTLKRGPTIEEASALGTKDLEKL